jgi:16S rRNA (uracil1498-N3)-methyltransferase
MRDVLPRFFAPAAASGGRIVTLSEDEAHHAARVMRLRPGDALAVFDGAGHEWQARAVEISKSAVQVELVEPIVPAQEPRVHITLIHAVLKGDHMDAVVRDATMIGVALVVPVITGHTAANVAAASGTKARERWQRVAIASAKQCRRAVVPRIEATASLEHVLRLGFGSHQGIVLAEPAAGPPHVALNALERAPERAAVAIGPEGGWRAEEIDAFRLAGFQPLTIGALTLRADAAALVAVSILRACWGDLSPAGRTE